jgi:ADP-ribose pyrophosphatase YjhB (NUDIX family)
LVYMPNRYEITIPAFDKYTTREEAAMSTEHRRVNTVQVCLVSARKSQGRWSIPGGSPDKEAKESPVNTVNRELREECGFTPNLFQEDDYVFTRLDNDHNDHTVQSHYYLKVVRDRDLFERLLYSRQTRFNTEIYGKASFDLTEESDGKSQYSLLGVLKENGSFGHPGGEVTNQNIYVTPVFLLLHRSGVSKGHIDHFCSLVKHELPHRWDDVVQPLSDRGMTDESIAQINIAITREQESKESAVSCTLIERRGYDQSLRDDPQCNEFTLVVIYLLYRGPSSQHGGEETTHLLLLQTHDHRLAIPAGRPERQVQGEHFTAVDVAQDVLWKELQIPPSLLSLTMNNYCCTRHIMLNNNHKQHHHQFVVLLEDYAGFQQLLKLSSEPVSRLGCDVTGFDVRLANQDLLDTQSAFIRLLRGGGSLIPSVDQWSSDVVLLLVHLQVIKWEDINQICTAVDTPSCNALAIRTWATQLEVVGVGQYVTAVNRNSPRYMTHVLAFLEQECTRAFEQLERFRRVGPISTQEYEEVEKKLLGIKHHCC